MTELTYEVYNNNNRKVVKVLKLMTAHDLIRICTKEFDGIPLKNLHIHSKSEHGYNYTEIHIKLETEEDST